MIKKTKEIVQKGNCAYEIDYSLGKVYKLTSNKRKGTTKKRELTCKKDGYIHCRINNRMTHIHRFIYECYYNKEYKYPEYEIDHINNNRDDNRIINLRHVSTQANHQNRNGAQKNSKSKIIGVYFNKNKWCSCIHHPIILSKDRKHGKSIRKTCSSKFDAQIHRKYMEFLYNRLFDAKFKTTKIKIYK